MATNQKQSGNVEIYNEVLEGTTNSVRILIEVPKVESSAQAYHKALKHSRNIPFDLDAINPLDKMYQYVLEVFPEFRGKPDRVKSQVRYFYDQLSGDAYRDAMMLAIIANADTKFDFEPEAYEKDESFMASENLPGLIGPPKLVPDIADPTEYRLKQFYDWLKANPEHLIKLQPAFELAVIKVNELAVTPKVDDAGFRAKPTG